MSQQDFLITEQFIRDEFNRLYDICKNSSPTWKIQFNALIIEPLRHTGKSTIYGQASNRGKVHINSIFIGLPHVESLRSTIVHELAHLCVGIDQGHNCLFKCVNADFRKICNISAEQAEMECNNLGDQVLKDRPPPLELYARTSCGNLFFVAKCFRRNKKYTQFPFSNRRLGIDGREISRFEYWEAGTAPIREVAQTP